MLHFNVTNMGQSFNNEMMYDSTSALELHLSERFVHRGTDEGLVEVGGISKVAEYSDAVKAALPIEKKANDNTLSADQCAHAATGVASMC